MSHLKIVTITLGAIFMPLAMYVGYSFGSEKYVQGLIAMGIYCALCVIDGVIFWKLIGLKRK